MADYQNPFLRGYFGAQENEPRNDVAGLASMQGLLGLQNALIDQQLHPLKVEQMQLALRQARQNADLRDRLTGGGVSGMGNAPLLGGATPTQPQGGVLGLPGNVQS